MTGPASDTVLGDIARGRADWRPWLAVLERVAESAGDRAWRLAVPDVCATGEHAPRLDGATFSLDARLVRRWARRLLETATAAGGAAASLDGLARAETTTLCELLEAGLVQDAARVRGLARRTGVDPDALAAVASVVAVPLLRACTERWREHMPTAWHHGYCPICGAWPSLAEARGLERARRLRCGRCAGDWSIAWLRCPYCGTDDHTRLGGLVAGGETPAATTPTEPAERPDASAPSPPRFARGVVPRDPSRTTTVDTCLHCRGYIKTVTTFGPTPADELGLLDLTTVELDVAAIEHGYQRPAGPGVPLGAHVAVRGTGLFAGWRG
jgi:FdhE protein